MPYNKPKGRNPRNASCARVILEEPERLLLPGSLLMAMLAQLFPALMFVDLRFSTFFQ
jgi:hypothetical protein